MTPPIPVTSSLREQMPDVAMMCDQFNKMLEIANQNLKTAEAALAQRDALASAMVELRAENEALRATLKAKGGAK
jgi:hypothetical protein